MKIGVIIQARMGSTRLPGKVLKPIAGKLLIEHVLGRLKGLNNKVLPVIATSKLRLNNVIEDYCKGRVDCFRGDELDVLGRYYHCAKQYGFDYVVRLTADNPFTDIGELDRLIDMHLVGGYDYSHSFNTMPIGVGAEIFTMNALEVSYNKGLLHNHREHVNEFIHENSHQFHIGELNVPSIKIAPKLRLTVDTNEDYENACKLAESVAPEWVSTEIAIAYTSDS
jgi:spore coat polysaccharide biosynthesis protein SpsF